LQDTPLDFDSSEAELTRDFQACSGIYPRVERLENAPNALIHIPHPSAIEALNLLSLPLGRSASLAMSAWRSGA
jgi:hypothetical protein